MQDGMAKTGEPRIGIIGAGAWGTAIAKALAEKHFNVDLWCFEHDLAEEINSRHVNERFLPGIALPPVIRASSDILDAVSGKDFLFLAVPSLYLMGIVRQILHAPEIREGKALISLLTKGLIDTDDGVMLITDALEEVLPGSYKGKLVYISGPSHAMEVAGGKITGLISASRSGKNSIRFRELLSGGRLVVFSSLDVRGVQVSAALKNVIAIAFGMLDALKESSDQFGDNTESLLLAAGLSEIQLVGRRMGATHPETFASIAGVGDLDVTCRSMWGRNRRFGREIILKGILERFKSVDELIAGLPSIGYIPEGVVTARHVHVLAGQKGLVLPISGGVFRVLNREAEPLSEVGSIIESIIGRSAGTARKRRRFVRFGWSGRSGDAEG
jgi:glycerol-3-phosphate dehydrogenase (NAD(P)+)